MGFMEISCDVGRWMELSQDGVQRQPLVLVLNLQVLLPKSFFMLICY